MSMSNGESRPSHFDAWRLGERPYKGRKNRIESLDDLRGFGLFMNDFCFERISKERPQYIAEWIFRSDEEIQNCPDLSEEEKSRCLQRFREREQGREKIRLCLHVFLLPWPYSNSIGDPDHIGNAKWYYEAFTSHLPLWRLRDWDKNTGA